MTGQKFKMTVYGLIAVMAWAVIEALLRKWGLPMGEWTTYIIAGIVAAFNIPQAFADAISKGATSTVAGNNIEAKKAAIKETLGPLFDTLDEVVETVKEKGRR